MVQTNTQNWTTRRLLEWTTQHLAEKGVDSPRLSADILLAHVLKQPRIHLYANMDRPATGEERASFRALVERAAKHEPVQYLVGEAHFYSLQFSVDSRVLIPRPSTETLVEHIISRVREQGESSISIADIGTGSGAIAISLAKSLPQARIIATDVSADALAVAMNNAQRHTVADRIDFRVGDLLSPLAGELVDVLVSNPPYISDAEWKQVPPNVKDHEPAGALRGGVDGMDVLRRLIADAASHVKRGGEIVLEIAASQKQSILDVVAGQAAWRNAQVIDDHEKLPRMFIADRCDPTANADSDS